MHRHFGALQGLAMILVVLSHSITMGFEATKRFGHLPVEGWQSFLLISLGNLGILAVPIFFFVSGSFFSFAAQSNIPPKLPYRVVWINLQRIWWPYFFWSIVFYAVIFFSRDGTLVPQPAESWRGQILPLTQILGKLQNYPFFSYLRNLLVGFPFHFVPLLAFYYTISPLIVTLARRFSKHLILVILLYQFFLLNFRFPGILGFTWPDWMRFLIPKVIGETLALWAIYFPMGMIYGIHIKSVFPWLKKLRWVSLIFTLIFFSISLLDLYSIWSFPVAQFIAPLTFSLFAPTLEYNSLPSVRALEKIGRRIYGLYLTNLIVLEISLLTFHIYFSELFSYPLILHLTIFILALWVPLLAMNSLSRLPPMRIYRYLFG